MKTIYAVFLALLLIPTGATINYIFKKQEDAKIAVGLIDPFESTVIEKHRAVGLWALGLDVPSFPIEIPIKANELFKKRHDLSNVSPKLECYTSPNVGRMDSEYGSSSVFHMVITDNDSGITTRVGRRVEIDWLRTGDDISITNIEIKDEAFKCPE